MITARVGEFGDKALGAEFGEVVAKGSERVAFTGAAKRFEDGGVELGRGEGIAGRDVCEAHERMHESELARVIEFEAWNTLSASLDFRRRQQKLVQSNRRKTGPGKAVAGRLVASVA